MKKIYEFLDTHDNIIWFALIELIVVGSLALLLGYNTGYNNAKKSAEENESKIVKETIEDTIHEVEKLVNNYNDCSTVFNTTGEFDNYDELWFDIANGHVRCLNLYGRLWMSYEENFQKWGSKSH